MKNLYSLIALLLSVAWLSPADAQPVHVQTNSKIVGGASSSINLNFAAASTSGHLIVVHLTWDKQNRNVNTISDTKGNTYHRIGATTSWGSTYRSDLWYAYNITAGASPLSITVTLTGAVNNLFEIYISEYSNVLTTADPLDKNIIVTGTNGTISAGPVTTTSTNQLIYGVAIGESVPLNGGSGFTVRSTAQQNIVEDKAGASVGSYSSTFTGGGNWIAAVATFKPLVTLPITLVSFDAKLLQDNKAELDWETATEANSDHFEVEHSNDGLSWSTIGRVDAAGNSVTPLQYSFVDDAPYTGVTYYRLSQVDRDGKSTISKTVTVHIDQQATATVRLYPNPATSYLVVEGASQAISIFSTAGQRMLVRVVPEGETKTTLDLTSLPKGAYFVKTGDKSTMFLRQ
jgi:hypothetical protein